MDVKKVETFECRPDIEIKQEEEEIEYYMEIAPNDMEEDVLGDVEPMSFIWTTEATACLIEQYKKFRSLVGQTTRMRSLRDMFEIISNEMKKRNFFFNSQKCENKWRVLERKYKQLVYREKMNKPGRIKDFYNWKHKKAMDDIFRNNLQQSSFDPKMFETVSTNSASVPSTNSTSNLNPKPIFNETVKALADISSVDEEDSLTSVLKNCFEEIKAKMDIAEANKERRHKEKMAIRRSELELQKKKLNLKLKELEVEKSKLLAAAKHLETL